MKYSSNLRNGHLSNFNAMFVGELSVYILFTSKQLTVKRRDW